MSEFKQTVLKSRKKTVVLLISVILLTLTVGTTVAFIIDKTQNVKNVFNPSRVTCEVTENFDGETKKNVNVENTSDVSVYVRVKLVTYRVNDNNRLIGGTADIPE